MLYLLVIAGVLDIIGGILDLIGGILDCIMDITFKTVHKVIGGHYLIHRLSFNDGGGI